MKFSYHTIAFNLLTRGAHPDIDRIIGVIGENGFAGVEGVQVNTESELIEVLKIKKKHGIEIVSVSSSNKKAGIEFSEVLGCEFCQVGGWSRNKLLSGDVLKDIDLLRNELAEMALYAEKRGVKIAVHPHLGQILENREEIDYFMEKERRNLFLLLDTAHQFAAGADPGELFKKYRDRTAHIHLKDWNGKNAEVIGNGTAGIEQFIEMINKEGYDGWLGVEHDRQVGWFYEEDFFKKAETEVEKAARFLKEKGYMT